MSRVLFFSLINISSVSNDGNSNDFHWINNNSYKNYLKLGCRIALQSTWPLWKWRVFATYLSLAATSRMSEAFFQSCSISMKPTFIYLPFYWYQYWYVCAIDKKCRWRYISADFTSPFCTRLKNNYRFCCVMENTEIWLADTRNKVTFMFA